MPNRHSATPPISSDPRLEPVMTYWQSLRQGRPVPPRTEVDPVAIQPHLGVSGIVERTENGAIRCRLAGRHLQALVGLELRGMPLRALFALHERDRLADLCTRMFDGPGVLTMTLATDTVRAQMALMPLSDTAGHISRALMVVSAPEGARCSVPCRFRIATAHLADTATGLSLPSPPQPEPTMGRPILRLIQGGLS